MESQVEWRYFPSGSHIWSGATSRRAFTSDCFAAPRVAPTSGAAPHPEWLSPLDSCCFPEWSGATPRIALTSGMVLLPVWPPHMSCAPDWAPSPWQEHGGRETPAAGSTLAVETFGTCSFPVMRSQLTWCRCMALHTSNRPALPGHGSNPGRLFSG